MVYLNWFRLEKNIQNYFLVFGPIIKAEYKCNSMPYKAKVKSSNLCEKWIKLEQVALVLVGLVH